MEAVAAVASIAGILSLIGESLNGTVKLRGFFSDMKSASATISEFLRDIDSLLQAIYSIRELIEKLPPDIMSTPVTSLQRQLLEYIGDVPRWLKTVRKYGPASGLGFDSWVKKAWVAFDINYFKEIRTELYRHKQDFVLRFSILGRTMDAFTIVEIKELDNKVSIGTAASLSEIEKQNSVLERIESISEIGMHSSVASVKSLQSIATSLSRLEAKAGSTEDFSRLRRRSSNADLWRKFRVNRPSNEDFEYRSRPSSRTSPITKESSFASLRNSTAVHGTSAHREEADNVVVSAEMISKAASAGSTGNYNLRSQKRINDLAGLAATQSDTRRDSVQAHHIYVGTPTSERLSDVHDWEHLSQAREAGRWGMHRLWNTLSEQQPGSVINYISLARKARIIQNKIDALNLVVHASDQSLTSSNDRDTQLDERFALQGRLENVESVLRAARIDCVSNGHSLYDIDQQLRPPITNDNHNRFWDQHNHPEGDQASNRYLLQMCGGKATIYGAWSVNRDRINHWMFHCLQSDDSQAKIHRSMMSIGLCRFLSTGMSMGQLYVTVWKRLTRREL